MARQIASLRHLKPLPKPSWNINCCVCDKPQARWELRVGAPGPVLICGACVLYGSEWGASNAELVLETAARIESQGKRFLRRDDQGKLASPSDADDVLGVIVLLDMTARRLPRR